MIARCIHNSGAELGVPARGLFYTSETVFHVTLGSEYLVLGMSLFKAGLTVLICDDTGKPNWWPISLFEFEDQTVPPGWEFALVDGKAAAGGTTANGVAAEWGYRDLVRDPSHADLLIERQPEALKIFFDELARRSGEYDQS